MSARKNSDFEFAACFRQTPCPYLQPKLVKIIFWHLAAVLLAGSVGAFGQSRSVQALPELPLSVAIEQVGSYHPITGRQRLNWFVKSTVGPVSLTAGVFSAAFSTATNSPSEYGPHWEGFGKRYGMRLTGISTGNAMEAGLGSLWGEDPRYFRAAGEPLKQRVKNIIVMTFAARRTEGNLAPAYARYIGTAGNNFLSNTWRADSQSSVSDACFRTLLGFAGRMGGNAFAEFWPDARKFIFRRK